MEQYNKKSAVVAEIEKRKKRNLLNEGAFEEDIDILYFIKSLEVKEINTWHLQEKENIYDAVKDWELHTFACIMKDGTIQRFNGILDEDCEGHINTHIVGVNDEYDNADDIVKWIEFT